MSCVVSSLRLAFCLLPAITSFIDLTLRTIQLANMRKRKRGAGKICLTWTRILKNWLVYTSSTCNPATDIYIAGYPYQTIISSHIYYSESTNMPAQQNVHRNHPLFSLVNPYGGHAINRLHDPIDIKSIQKRHQAFSTTRATSSCPHLKASSTAQTPHRSLRCVSAPTPTKYPAIRISPFTQAT